MLSTDLMFLYVDSLQEWISFPVDFIDVLTPENHSQTEYIQKCFTDKIC